MGRTSFYFISKDLDNYIEPPVPYSRIFKCKLDHKRKTLMQIQLSQPESLNDPNRENSADPNVKLELEIEKTYGREGEINIYCQDRHAA